MEGLAGMGVALVLVGLFVGVLWILLPFAVFGIKPMITQAIAEAKQANMQLKALIDQQRVLIEQQKVIIAGDRVQRERHRNERWILASVRGRSPTARLRTCQHPSWKMRCTVFFFMPSKPATGR